MNKYIQIDKLPYPIEIKGGETKEFYFAKHIVNFIIRSDYDNLKLDMHLKKIPNDKKSIFQNAEIDIIGYSSIVFFNNDNKIIRIILNKLL